MSKSTLSFLAATLAAALPISALAAGPASAQEAATADDAVGPQASAFATLHRFSGTTWWPRGGVALDDAGNLYGTTLYGGNCTSCGAIWRMTKPAAGKTAWGFEVLHKFVLGPDGIAPTAPLVIHKGVIYGTTSAGANPACGCGEVFRIARSGGKWTYTVLHRFDRTRGTTPIGGLLVDADGSLYGTTTAGGGHDSGVLYRISPSGGFSVLHSFQGGSGGGPQGELRFGKDGAIYGATYGGGKYNQGVVFRITKGGAYKVLHDFLGVNQPGGSHDGAQPEGRIAMGGDGTLYGTTSFGGTPLGYGTAWSLKPPASTGGAWTYRQIYIFGQSPTLPNTPHAGLLIDGGGHLWGTSAGGGRWGGGTLYRLTRPTTGTTWKATVMHDFEPRSAGGDTPYGVGRLAGGRYWATTLTGGTIVSGSCINGCGTVFSYTLP